MIIDEVHVIWGEVIYCLEDLLVISLINTSFTREINDKNKVENLRIFRWQSSAVFEHLRKSSPVFGNPR